MCVLALTSQPKRQSYNDHVMESKDQTCVRQFIGIHEGLDGGSGIHYSLEI